MTSASTLPICNPAIEASAMRCKNLTHIPQEKSQVRPEPLNAAHHSECIQLPQELNMLALFPLARRKISKRMQHKWSVSLQTSLQLGILAYCCLHSPSTHEQFNYMGDTLRAECKFLHELNTPTMINPTLPPRQPRDLNREVKMLVSHPSMERVKQGWSFPQLKHHNECIPRELNTLCAND